MANQVVNLAANQGSPAITIVDSTSSLQVFQKLLQSILFAATATFVDLSFKTQNGTNSITLPVTPVFFVYIRNVDTAADITVNYTPAAGTPGTMVLQKGATAGTGGVFIYTTPVSGGTGGFISLSITATGVQNVEVIVAG